MQTANHVVVTLVVACLVCAACGKGEQSQRKTSTNIDAATVKVRRSAPISKKKFAGRMDRSMARFNRPSYKFGFDSVKIVYEHANPLEMGTATVWITNAGAVIGVVRKMTSRADKRTVVQTILWKDSKTTQWDDKTKTAYITQLRHQATQLRKISSDDPKLFKRAGYAKLANETVAGKSCQVWRNKRQRVKLWRWHGVELRFENNALVNRTSKVVATSVKLGVKLPLDVFTPPDGYTVIDRTK